MDIKKPVGIVYVEIKKLQEEINELKELVLLLNKKFNEFNEKKKGWFI